MGEKRDGLWGGTNKNVVGEKDEKNHSLRDAPIDEYCPFESQNSEGEKPDFFILFGENFWYKDDKGWISKYTSRLD